MEPYLKRALCICPPTVSIGCLPFRIQGKIPEPSRQNRREISLGDALMAGFAMFALKAPSLLAFEHQRQTNAFNLKGIFGLKTHPLRYPNALHQRRSRSPSNCDPPSQAFFANSNAARFSNRSFFLQGQYLLLSTAPPIIILRKDPLSLLPWKGQAVTGRSPIPPKCWGRFGPSRLPRSHPPLSRTDYQTGRRRQERL